MHGKQQFQNSVFRTISHAATAACAITVVFALMVVLTQSAQAQAPAGGGRWTEKVPYSFCSQTNCTDGAYPSSGLIRDAAGNLYGTTLEGGAYNYGTVFELTPAGAGAGRRRCCIASPTAARTGIGLSPA